MDASTPQNPNKPRLSRRLLSHFTLTLSILLALSFVTLAVVGPTTEKTEAIAPVVIGGIIVAAAVAGFIGGWLAHQSDNAVWEADKYAYADALITSFDTAREYSKSAIWNDAELFEMATYKYVRFAEYAAKQLYDDQAANGEDFDYDPVYVLSQAGILNEMVYFVSYADELYNTLYQPWANIQDNFVGSFEDMSYGFGVGSLPLIYTNIDLDYNLTAIHTNKLTSGAGAYLYMSNGSNLKILNRDGAAKSIVVNIIKPDDTVALTTTQSAAAYELIDIDLTNLQAGPYRIATSGTNFPPVILGEAVPAITNAGSISNAWVVGKVVDGKIIVPYYVYSTGDNGYTYLRLDADTTGTTGTPSDVKIGFNANSKTWNNNGPGNTSGGVMHDLTLYKANLTGQIASMLTTINNFAQSKYNMIVAQGGMDLPDPSVVFPNLDNLDGYTWEQIYAIYIAYLNSMWEHFQNYSSITPDYVNISAESLKLKIRGSIHDNDGNLLADNTSVFTPFISYGDEHLEIGENTWNSAGWAIIWGNGTCAEISIPNLKYLELAANYTLDIEEIMYDGQYVDEISLTVDRLSLILPNTTDPPDPPHSITVTDLEWLAAHWYYFAIIAGVICLLAAISFRNMAIIAVGLILIAAGGIGYWMAGDYSLMDWFSMEPADLRAWLQNLR